MSTGMNTQSAPEWQKLQRKIFSRWVNQKLIKRNIAVKDVVDDIQTGLLLVSLLEVLSEKTFSGKMDKAPKLKANKIDNLSIALKFVWECGVEMKLKPSAEQLHDGDQSAILGLIWAIMSKYMKIGDDDEEQLSAKDALILWAQNKTHGYKDVKLEKFGKDWHDGLALCAIIHKHRPKLINYSTLDKNNKINNLKLAMDAAEKYFGLEKYLTAEDITKLDENSMVVYVSEYYYGIAEQRKLDLAAKRIGKVIKLTKENDAMRAEYNSTAQKFKERVTKVEKVLEDRTIDNTMAGAKKKIADFYDYKTKDKNVILGHQLDLEALFNNLAMRLAHHKRPEFAPPAGLSLTDIAKVVAHLEACEQERKVALHAELNRQIRLVQLDDQHKSRFQQLKTWSSAKEAYLKTKEVIESVSAAELQLRLFEAYEKENVSVSATIVVQLQKLGEELVREKYERSAEVQARDKENSAAFTNLGKLATEKKPVLDDALAREKFKEKVRSMNVEHINNYNKLASWIAEKEAYLNLREQITSVSESRTQLSLFDSYEKEKETLTVNEKAELFKLGAEVLASRYETKYSSWSIEKPEDLKSREQTVESKWKHLSELSAEKKRVLDDHLAREEFAEKVRMMNRNHVDKFEKLQVWIAEKEAYLKVKESISTVAEARTALSKLEAYQKEKTVLTGRNVAQLKTLGVDILAQKYQTKYSSYVFEHPADLKARESTIDAKWAELTKLSDAKKKVLDEDLARELEKERLRMEFARLASEFTRYTGDTAEDVNVAHFGFTLEEVEAYQAVLDKQNGEISNNLKTKSSEYEDIHKKGANLGVKENVYTSLTLENLAKSRSVLEAALEKRSAAFKAELARQRANDALCKEFAAAADPFVKTLLEQKDKITKSKAELEEQLKYVQERIRAVPQESSKMKPIQDLNAKIEAAGVTNNKHTTLTAKDVEVQWEQYQAFLNKKVKMLEEEIEHHKLRGITQEQFAEIEANFKQFDTDHSGFIDKKELKALLYSLGEEKSRTEVEQIMTKYAGKSDKGIAYESFKEFMIDLLGVSISKDDIVNAFVLVNKGDAVAKVDKMDMVMETEDIDYIKTTASKKGDGYDYHSWTNDVFSR